MDYDIVGNVFAIPLMHIFVDPSFNCRGRFDVSEVYDLGCNIKLHGQIAPVIVQPMEDVPEYEKPNLSDAWPFRLIAGHRRYMAIDQWTDQKTINACIEEGLTPEQAETMNFTENLKRKDLNMLQEAEFLARAWPIEPTNSVASIIGESRRWVAARRALLELPEYIQKAAASGRLAQYDVETLAEVDEKALEPTFQKIVTGRGKPGKAPPVKGRYGWKKRPRGRAEISRMITLLHTLSPVSKLTPEELNRVASALAWAAREIDSVEFLEKRLDFPEGYVIVDVVEDKIKRLSD